MKTDNRNFPIGEDYQYFVNNTKIKNTTANKAIRIVTGLITLLLISGVLAVSYQAFNEIQNLRFDLNNLKVSFEELQSRLYDDQYDDIYTEDPEFTQTQTEMQTPKPGIIDNSIYAYPDYNDDEDDDEDEADTDQMQNLETILTGDKFTKDAKHTEETSRFKRNTVGYTNDGVPINSESFSQAQQKNATLTKKPQDPSTSAYSSVTQQTSASPRPINFNSKRAHIEAKAFRVVKKKELKSGDYQESSTENSDVEFTIVRDEQLEGGRFRHRPNHIENLDERSHRIGRMRPLPTAHFSGDTSKYVLGHHDNFKGNGRLRHPQRTFVDWSESNWFHSLGMDRHFSLTNGILTIKDTGIYFVYAQIYYYDEHDTNGFRVYKNSDTLLQCTIMSHSVDRIMKGNTCYTAAAEYLQEGDRISLGDLSDSRYSLFEPGKSFFGLIKLGDVKIK